MIYISLTFQSINDFFTLIFQHQLMWLSKQIFVVPFMIEVFFLDHNDSSPPGVKLKVEYKAIMYEENSNNTCKRNLSSESRYFSCLAIYVDQFAKIIMDSHIHAAVYMCIYVYNFESSCFVYSGH